MNRYSFAAMAAAVALVFVGQQLAYPKVKIGDQAGAVNGLRLTLRADVREVGLEDGKIATPAKLKLTFVNVGDKAIKLNAYDFTFSRIRGEVKGVSADSFRVEKMVIRRKLPSPRPEDFPEIKPGETWTPSQGLAFPGAFAEAGDTLAHYLVTKPGEFRLQVRYRSEAVNHPAAEGAWVGEVSSNELAITAK